MQRGQQGTGGFHLDHSWSHTGAVTAPSHSQESAECLACRYLPPGVYPGGQSSLRKLRNAQGRART